MSRNPWGSGAAVRQSAREFAARWTERVAAACADPHSNQRSAPTPRGPWRGSHAMSVTREQSSTVMFKNLGALPNVHRAHAPPAEVGRLSSFPTEPSLLIADWLQARAPLRRPE